MKKEEGNRDLRDFRDDGDVIVMFRFILVYIVVCVLLGLLVRGVG